MANCQWPCSHLSACCFSVWWHFLFSCHWCIFFKFNLSAVQTSPSLKTQRSITNIDLKTWRRWLKSSSTRRPEVPDPVAFCFCTKSQMCIYVNDSRQHFSDIKLNWTWSSMMCFFYLFPFNTGTSTFCHFIGNSWLVPGVNLISTFRTVSDL